MTFPQLLKYNANYPRGHRIKEKVKEEKEEKRKQQQSGREEWKRSQINKGKRREGCI